MAQQEVRIHLRTTKVEITPLHTGSFIRFDAVLDGERRGDGGIQNFNGIRKNLDLACCHVRVLGTLAARTHATGNLKHVLTTKMLRDMEFLLGHAIGVDDDLRIALAIAKIAENQPAVVAIMPGPASQHNLAANVALAQLAARGSVHAKIVLEIRH